MNRCTYVLTRGVNKGLTCGIGCRGTFCTIHTPEYIAANRRRSSGHNMQSRADRACSSVENRCCYVLLKGINKGLICGRGCRGSFCSSHTPECIENSRKRSAIAHGTYRPGLCSIHWAEVSAKALAETPRRYVSQASETAQSVEQKAICV